MLQVTVVLEMQPAAEEPGGQPQEASHVLFAVAEHCWPNVNPETNDNAEQCAATRATASPTPSTHTSLPMDPVRPLQRNAGSQVSKQRRRALFFFIYYLSAEK